jgi:hypothetical protein
MARSKWAICSTGIDAGNVTSRPPMSETRIGSMQIPSGNLPRVGGPITTLAKRTGLTPPGSCSGLPTTGESLNLARHQ